MISIMTKYLCKEDVSLIENYEAAINDNTQIWDCHHRNEITMNKTKDELKALHLYYDRPASELIFLTRSDHCKLHTNNKRFTGKHHTKTAKKKIGAASKGNEYHKRFDIWEKKDKVLSLYNSGLSDRKIAKIMNCSRTVISNIIKKLT